MTAIVDHRNLANRVDAITLEVLGNRLHAVSEEMSRTLIRTAYSTNIKERLDCATAVFDAQGRMIAQDEQIPMLLGSLQATVSDLLAKRPIASLKPGDMFISNDPYSGGGTHLPDITVAAPVFMSDRLVGFVANIAHHGDIGGKVAGSVAGDAASIFEEGIRIPLVKICQSGEAVQDVINFITLNSRLPGEREGDLAAQIAANRTGAIRLVEVISRYGIERYNAVSTALLDYAEALMRDAVAAVPDGTYSFTDYMDSDGIVLDKPIPIKATVTISGETAHVDFSGSSPQVKGPINVPLNATLTTVFYSFKALMGPSIPANDGVYRVLKVTAPPGSIVNCQPPAAVGGRVVTCYRIADVIFGAMAAAIPDRVLAGCHSAGTSVTFGGTVPATGSFYVYLEVIAGGSGAHAHGDGLSGIQVHMTNTSNLPVEALEREYPLMVKRYELIPDSGGAGRYRGGLGIQRDILVLHDHASFTSMADRQLFAPWGLDGGLSGSPGKYFLKHPDGSVENIPSKGSNIPVNKGDLVCVFSPGAGGYGSPLEREPRAVLADVLEGWVSAQAARDLYGVVLKPGEQAVDEIATERLRETMRKQS